MQVKILARGDAGLPTDDEIDDLSDRMVDLRYTRAALWESLTAEITMEGTFEDGYTIARHWLGNPVEIWSPDGTWCWEGIIWEITFGAGQRTRSRSLEAYANRARVHWNSLAGPQVPIVADDIDGQRLYGIIEYQHNAGGTHTTTSATALAAEVLGERSTLFWLPATLGAEPSIELRCMGGYRTLGYEACLLPTWGDSDIALIIQSILTAHCPWISFDYSQIPLTGVLASAMFDGYESCMEAIKRLVAQLPGYTFGIGRGRVAYLRPLHRLNTTEDYVEQRDGSIETVGGAAVQPWDVRPDMILRQADFISGGPYTAEALRAVENIFLTETEYSYKTNSVRYTPIVAGVRGNLSAL